MLCFFALYFIQLSTFLNESVGRQDKIIIKKLSIINDVFKFSLYIHIIIIIIMNNIFTRYNFTYQKYYVHERKEKGDLPTGRAHTSIEIRNTIFTRKLFKIHIYISRKRMTLC